MEVHRAVIHLEGINILETLDHLTPVEGPAQDTLVALDILMKDRVDILGVMDIPTMEVLVDIQIQEVAFLISVEASILILE